MVALLMVVAPLVTGWSLPMRWRLKKAENLYHKGQHADAAKVYEEAQLQRPDDPMLSYNLGTALHKADSLHAAATSLLGALSSHDSTVLAKAYYNLGNTHYRLGQWRQAAATYVQSLQYDPSDPDAKHNLELVLRKMKEAREEASERQGTDRHHEPPEKQRDESSDEKGSEDQQKPHPSEEQPDSTQAQSPQQSQEGAMSPEDAERLLEALAEQEMQALREAQNVPRAQEQPVGADW